jgi:hypothetical protein
MLHFMIQNEVMLLQFQSKISFVYQDAINDCDACKTNIFWWTPMEKCSY